MRFREALRAPYSHTGAHVLFANALSNAGQDARRVIRAPSSARLLSGKPQTEVVVAVRGMLPVAVGRPHVASVAVPRATTDHPVGTLMTGTRRQRRSSEAHASTAGRRRSSAARHAAESVAVVLPMTEAIRICSSRVSILPSDHARSSIRRASM